MSGLVAEFNEYLEIDDGSKMSPIDPDIIGVVFTMIQINSGEPINAQKPFIKQTSQLGIPTFENYFRENKSIFGESPQYGVPAVMNAYNSPTHGGVVKEIEAFVSEFEERIGL